MADATLSQRWVSNYLTLVTFQDQVLVKCIYRSANLYPASETEESSINFRHCGNTLVKMSANHLLGPLAVVLLKVIEALKSGAFLVKATSLKQTLNSAFCWVAACKSPKMGRSKINYLRKKDGLFHSDCSSLDMLHVYI